MLGLLAPTDPAWARAAANDLERLLTDHAHCELKAAQSALSIVGRFGGAHPSLVAPLLDLAQEETEHFRKVEREARERGFAMPAPSPDDYVLALQKASKHEAKDVPRLLDRLLVSALIEARSCERFKLLADQLGDAPLGAFYRELMASEARHHRLFVRLAEEIFGEETTHARFATLARREAEITGTLALGPTVHG
jgi:tRNA-(ms[2]io[6]A)-hydroxylase